MIKGKHPALLIASVYDFRDMLYVPYAGLSLQDVMKTRGRDMGSVVLGRK
jgi:hypothetical protein